MKVYINSLNESWVVDRFKDEWIKYNPSTITKFKRSSDIIWIIAPWNWENVPKKYLKKKKVICSIYHIDEAKFDETEKKNFFNRDQYVDNYHVISKITKLQIEKLTNKPITVIPFWINQNIWKDEERNIYRKKYKFQEDAYLIGSFQRDTEGSDLVSPKLSKGPDQFLKIITEMIETIPNIEIVLTGKRRNYLINKFQELGIKYHYFEMLSFKEINELYNSLDLYIVASRYEGGPQSILECALTKTPIISSRVGISELILSEDSIFEIDKYYEAKPNVEVAYKNVQKYCIPQGFENFMKLFKETYEN